jgi:hypothetical protein
MINITSQIVVGITGDGTSTSFSVDLKADPYFVGGSGALENWFSSDKHGSVPVSAVAPSGEPYSAGLSGTTVTVNFTTAPAAGFSNVPIFLLF